MKLIIDIPESLHKATVNGLDANEIWNLRLAVKNGIPLDDLRDEIKRNAINYNNSDDYKRAIGLVLSIINNYNRK